MSETAFTTRRVTVVGRQPVARNVIEFTLAAVSGDPLPALGPGTHIDVDTPAGAKRSYSLTHGRTPIPNRYQIAVALQADGTGGSASMHRDVEVGTEVSISAPRGELDTSRDSDVLLIAGGIGITPIRSLYHSMSGAGKRVRMVYLFRSNDEAAYIEEFNGDDVVLYSSAEHGRRFDLWSVLAEPGDTRLYCCGPVPLLQQVKLLTMHWRASRLHFEDFTGVTGLDPFAAPFTVRWAPTDTFYPVDTTKSLLDVLQGAGIPVPSSCRAGTCGTCKLALLSGDAIHRDVCLTADEQAESIIPCVSRGAGVISVDLPNGVASD